MKTMKSKKGIWTWLFLGLMVTSVTFLLTACGDSGKSKGSTSTSVRRACKGCAKGSDQLLSGLGNATNDVLIQLALDFYTDGDFYDSDYEYDYGMGIGGNRYEGPVTASGYMIVEDGNLDGCTIPDGVYTVKTEGPGDWDILGTAYDLRLVATKSKAKVTMTLDYAYFFPTTPDIRSCKGHYYDSEMYAAVTIETVTDGSHVFSCRYGGYIAFNDPLARFCH